MRIIVTMLGTSSMVPTRARSAPAVLIEYAGEYILVDCGEGTQRQMNIAGKSRAKVRKILLTHWHGDHVGGLGPLLQTLFNSQSAHDVELFGPKGTRHRFECLACAMEIPQARVQVRELDQDGEFYAAPDYSLGCVALAHGLPTLGYALIEAPRRHIDVARAAALGLEAGPLLGRLQAGESVIAAGREVHPDEVTYMTRGKKIAIITDTLPVPAVVALARDADLLICEATYLDEHAELARTYNHMTARQAAALAHEANVKRLVLTHFSQRYDDTAELVAEAASILPATVAAADFTVFEV